MSGDIFVVFSNSVALFADHFHPDIVTYSTNSSSETAWVGISRNKTLMATNLILSLWRRYFMAGYRPTSFYLCCHVLCAFTTPSHRVYWLHVCVWQNLSLYKQVLLGETLLV